MHEDDNKKLVIILTVQFIALPVGSCMYWFYRKCSGSGGFSFCIAFMSTFLTATFQDLDQICFQLQYSDFEKKVFESLRSSEKEFE